MEQILLEQLRTYIICHNPDLLLKLQSANSSQGFLENKVKGIVPLMDRMIGDGCPRHVIEELCLVEMTASLRPSKFKYIRKLLKDTFYEDYNRMRETGTLTYETIQLVDWCEDGFACFDFNEDNEEDALLKEIICQAIQRYLERK